MTATGDDNGGGGAADPIPSQALSAVNPSLLARLRASACYVGLYPFAMGTRRRPSGFLRLHRDQSQTLFAVFLLHALLTLCMIGGLSYAIAFRREWVERFPLESWALSVWRKTLLVWVVFWGYGVWRALRGSRVPVPFLGPLRRRAAVRITGLCASQLLLVAVVAAGLLNLRAQMLLHHGEGVPRVYLIYDDLDRFPEWMFRTAFYPVIAAATEKWGPGSAAVKPISRAAIQDALHRGVFVFVGSHGTERGLLLDEGYLTPLDIPAFAEHSRLRYVYLAGCDSGAQRAAWEEALRPAEVKTYDRMTPVLEHLWWLWARGPAVIRNIPE